MRKNIKKFAGIVLCIGMFTGCAQTPDSSLVKPKGSKAVDAYTEADDVSGSKGEASESKNDDGSESKTTIRNLIDAPQNYKSHVEDDSAKLVVNTDASVEIPEVEKISAISVTAAEVTQELLDRITNAFFSEAKLYTLDSYYVKTKDEIKKTLDELKEDVANGNLDPYNYGTDDDGNYVYDIYEDIETWEHCSGKEIPDRGKTCCRKLFQLYCTNARRFTILLYDIFRWLRYLVSQDQESSKQGRGKNTGGCNVV